MAGKKKDGTAKKKLVLNMIPAEKAHEMAWGRGVESAPLKAQVSQSGDFENVRARVRAELRDIRARLEQLEKLLD